MAKKILFAAPNHFGIYKRVIKDLKCSGYEVTSVCIEDWPEKKILNKKKSFHKLRLLLDSNYESSFLENLIAKESEIPNILAKFPENYFDYCFFIRPDFFSKLSIEKCIKVSKYSIAYQWDGLDRYPNIIDKIYYFDKFLVFDNLDYIKYKSKFDNIHLGSNFYFDNDDDIPRKEVVDVFYLGAFVKDRNEKMMRIYDCLSNSSLKIKIFLCQIPLIKDNVEKFSNDDIIFIDKIMDYSDTLSYTKSAKIILDLLIEEHSGLSFRFFEAMKYNVKVITTNSSVVNYDFYHPNNIFVFNDNYLDLKEFIELPYKILPVEITNKYKFINWFNSNLEKNT